MKIEKHRIGSVFARIAERMPLYVPMRIDGAAGADFALWEAGAPVDFQTLKTALSPKGFFLPASEGLYSTHANDQNAYSITPAPAPEKPFAVFGVRACDAAAVHILDSVFLGETADRFYQARRQAATLITLACAKPGPTCFCQTFGINPAEPGGDISVWETDDFFYWQPQTHKGEQLTAQLADILEAADNHVPEPVKTYAHINRPPPPTAETPLALFESPVWDKLHDACIACGTCTFLCPTCQCYDMANEVASVTLLRQHETPANSGGGPDVHHHRCWDTCLNADFTQMAHGNPRPTKKERFRQRFMHKLAYHPQKYGLYGCVGCGRCADKCPVNMHMAKVIAALEAQHA